MLRRALIVGGSMAGLFAGLYLRRRGWDVDILERSASPLHGRGAGITTHPQMRRALADLGIEAERDFGVPIEDRLVLDRDGTIIARRPLRQISTSWNRLLDLVLSAFGPSRYHRGKEFLSVSQTADAVIAQLRDGTTLSADLLIGADGLRSAVRAQFLPQAEPRYAGYVGWRGLVDEASLSGTLPPEIFAAFAFALPPGEHMLSYPVAGPGNDLRPGHRSWNVVWYRPADEIAELPRLLTDDSGHTHRLSIPPTLVSREAIAEMHDAGARLLAPAMHRALRLIARPFLQPIYDLESDALAFGCVALIGDAAFVARPHIGGAIVKAIEDAATLAAALDHGGSVPEALRAFEVERLRVGRAFVAQSRKLGGYFRDQRLLPRELAERTLSETALLDFPH